MADRKPAATILFVALCGSVFFNFILAVSMFQRAGVIRELEVIPRFREVLVQRGGRVRATGL